MNNFGSGGLFLCYVIAMLFLTIVFGWPAFVIQILVTIGYAALLGELDDRFCPNRKTRRRSRRKKMRCRKQRTVLPPERSHGYDEHLTDGSGIPAGSGAGNWKTLT